MSLASGSDRASRSSLVTTNVSPGPAGASAGADRDGRSIAPLTVIDKDVQAKRAIRADTVFRIGEVSKQLTATAVLLLAQDGQLALDDRLSQVVAASAQIGR
jgi:CubicO group peptidase (beta-lactamase class C family)